MQSANRLDVLALSQSCRRVSQFPLLHNNEELTGSLALAMRDYFGEDFWDAGPISIRSEDFNTLSIDGTPTCFWHHDGIDPRLWDEAEAKGKLAEGGNP